MRFAVETRLRGVSTLTALRLVVALLCVAAVSITCGDGDETAPTPLPSDPAGLTRIGFANADGEEIDLLVEVADSPEERSVGLMFRESMPEDHGMLFVFELDGQHSFYMRNTLVPLSIAFIKSDGTIVEIEDMEPQTEELHSGPEPYLYSVEANQGWFARNGIGAGSRTLIASLTPEPTPSPSSTPGQ